MARDKHFKRLAQRADKQAAARQSQDSAAASDPKNFVEWIEHEGQRMRSVMSCGFVVYRESSPPSSAGDAHEVHADAASASAEDAASSGPDVTFLALQKHAKKYNRKKGKTRPSKLDLAKGHRHVGESPIETAWRELEEETGLSCSDVDLVEGFRYESVYFPSYSRYDGDTVRKSIVIFAAVLRSPETSQIRVSNEHAGFRWVSLGDKSALTTNGNATLRAVVQQLKDHIHS